MKKTLLFSALLLSFFLSKSQCNSADIYAEEDDNAVCFEILDNIRYIYSNNIPDHEDNPQQGMSIPSDPVAGDYAYTMCAYPDVATTFTPLYEETETTVGCENNYQFGVATNGVRFDPSSAETFVKTDGSNNIEWHVEATSLDNEVGVGMGTDNGGHMNSPGEYHYHNIPKVYYEDSLGIDESAHSPIVGYAADGFPIYYKYVFAATADALSAITAASSGYSLKSGTRPGDGEDAPDGTYNGEYYEDYEYSSANTILDECNGRYGVTPDFPYATYYYVLTDEYPYIPRCFKGTVMDNTFRVGPDAACVNTKNATQDQCSAVVSGCMDPFSDNYNANANFDDGSCSYSSISWNGSWSNFSGPNKSIDVTLNSNFTFSQSSKFSCRNLTVNSGTTLTVDTEEALVVYGGLTNNGSIIIESGGSLITYDSQSFTGNDITIKRNTRYADGKYSFVGSPMQQNSSITGADLGITIYKYDETIGYGNQGLMRWLSAKTDGLTPGRGYAQAFQQEITFTGTPNSGDITYTGTFTDLPNSNPEGWNLVSNPYPAAISVSRFLNENDNIEGAVYIWDDNDSETVRGSNDDYIVANGIAATHNSVAGNDNRYNQHVGVAQAFFVKLLGASDLGIDFTEEMRVSDRNADDNFFRKNEDEEIPFVRVNLTNTDGLFEQTIIGWTAEASETQIVRAYDAPVFDIEAGNLLFTEKANKALAIQGVTMNTTSISVKVKVEQAGTYTLALDQTDYPNQSFWLKDKQTETTTAYDQPYSFYMANGDVAERFELLTENSVLSAEAVDDQIFVHNNVLNIVSKNQTISEYRIFDLSGSLVLKTQVLKSAQINLNHLKSGIYLVSSELNSLKIIVR